MKSVLSQEGRAVFELVNFVCICGIVSIFGILANMINAVIFYKQGFKNTVNIGFFGLAISDIVCLLTAQWISISMNPLFASTGVPWFPSEVMYLSGGWPHVCSTRITSFITVYITAERYLSIALPLKVKNIITPKVTTIILCLIFCVNLITLFPEYATSYLGWRFFPEKNHTLIGIMFTSSRNSVEGVVYVLHSILGMSSFVGVIIFTTLLVIKLGQTSRWRRQVTSGPGKQEAMSNRDQKTGKMVVVIASVLIACYTPGAIIALTAFVVGPEFNVRGVYFNISESMWSIACAVQAINSSVNIFFYYYMSTRYRQTMHEVILRCKMCYRTTKS